jgi:hypothetical protein
MYERMVDEPRLTWWWTEAPPGGALPVLAEMLDVVAAGSTGRSTASA